MDKRKAYLVIAVFCAIKLTLHLIADFNSGFQGDELLHIETGHYPAFGYMEFPPMIGWLAFVQNLLQSQSVLAHHLFAHIASLMIVILAALTTVELGGRLRAVVLICLCILAAPAFGRGHQLFQPTVFTQMFWLLCFYQMVRFLNTLDRKYLLYLSISAALAFLCKYDSVFFFVGMLPLVLFKRPRRAILQKSSIKYALLFLFLISPNIWWQIQHHFPLRQHMSELYASQLNGLRISKVVSEIFLHLNPLTSPFWIGGLIFLFQHRRTERFRIIGASIMLSLIALAVAGGKSYYYFAAMITLLICGGIWFERLVSDNRKWLLYPALILLAISGALLAPLSLSILPLNKYIRLAGTEEENGRYPVRFAEFYSHHLWPATMDSIKAVYDQLPVDEQNACLIWGKHYSQAGAVNLYRHRYGLPKAISYHGSFYTWAPDQGHLPTTVIAFSRGDAGRNFWTNYFGSVTGKARVRNIYADEERDEWQTIYVCREPKQDFAGLKELFKNKIFE